MSRDAHAADAPPSRLRSGAALLAAGLASPAAAFALALAVRVAAIFVLGFYRDPETWENGAIATNVWNGHGFSASLGRELEPTSYQGPPYPYLLLASWALFGRGPAAYLVVSLLQAVAVASMVFPVRALTLRWFAPVPAALAMWLCALAPLCIWFPTRIHHTALILAAHPWLLLGWLTLARPPTSQELPAGSRWMLALGTGALTAGAALMQPLLLPTYGLISAGLLARALVARQRARALGVFVAGLATLAVLTPWTIRNYEVHGRLLPVKDNFPKELWMGNNPHATGTSFAEGGEVEITIAHPPAAFELRGHVSEIELFDALEAEAMAYIRADPVAFLGRTARKIFWFWTNPPSHLAHSYGAATPVVQAVYLGYWLFFLGLFAIAAVGRRIPREYLWVLAAFVFVHSLVYGLTHVGQPRFRGEIEFLFLPGAGAGAAWLLARCWPAASAALARATARAEAALPGA